MMSFKRSWIVVAIAALVIVSSVRAEEEAEDSRKPIEGPFVHVHKEFDVNELTVGQPMEFSVEIHNLGNADAYNVDFFDDAVAAEEGKSLQLKRGSVKNHFDKIESGDYVTFKQVIVPLVSGPMLIPSAVVTYTDEKTGGKKQSVVGAVDGFNVMTGFQKTTKDLLKIGKFATFGFCKTVADWVRFGIFFAAIAGIILSKTTFTKAKSLKDARSRTLARRALGVEDIMKDE
mmetsp:Transcript_29969/g.63894  ORF Transcript_29969/g.63894 Transcript_29969/m.63894 type:complete len:231 (-) Transcript_29969:205-897(-)